MTKQAPQKEISHHLERLKVEPVLQLELIRPFQTMLSNGAVVIDAHYLVPGEAGGKATIRLSIDVLEMVELQNAIRMSLMPPFTAGTN